MRRREFMAGIAATATASPFVARAQQQPELTRRIGVVMGTAAHDSEGQARMIAFVQGLEQSGWSIRRNLSLDIRWTEGDLGRSRLYARELVSLSPDVILAGSSAMVTQLLEVTRTIPIVFAQTADPVGAGFVASLARPGGNATGFMSFEYSISGKWLELLKEVTPTVKRAAVLRDASDRAGMGQWAAIQALAPVLGFNVSPISVDEPDDMERDIAEFARAPNGGLVVTGSAPTLRHRDRIVSLTARLRLPAVYPYRYHVLSGGLIAYGADTIDQFRRAAGYVDFILKGEKPADLPVQAPTRYELVINLKTAKALGLDVPATVLARADEVIE